MQAIPEVIDLGLAQIVKNLQFSIPQLTTFYSGMFNGKFPFPTARMASNFSLPVISHTGIPGKFPRLRNFPSFGNFPSRGNLPKSRPAGNSHFLSAHISDFQSIFWIKKLFFPTIYKRFFVFKKVLDYFTFKKGGSIKHNVHRAISSNKHNFVST